MSAPQPQTPPAPLGVAVFLSPDDLIVVQYLSADNKIVFTSSFTRDQALEHVATLTKMLGRLPASGDNRRN
jgi:hypothetical protein